MPNPEEISIKTYLIIMGLSLWGGVANFISRFNTDPNRKFSIAEFIGELTISGFTGIVTYFICFSFGFNPLLTAALVGISGHMGSRFIFKLEMYLENVMIRYSNITAKEDSNIITEINIKDNNHGRS